MNSSNIELTQKEMEKNSGSLILRKNDIELVSKRKMLLDPLRLKINSKIFMRPQNKFFQNLRLNL